jgi:hypothetical protein
VDGVDPAAVQAATSTGSVCRQCHQKPQQKGHPYCSKGCAKAYDQSHVWSAQLEKTATKGVKKYTIDDQLSSMSAMQTEDAAHFNTAYTQYGKLLQGQQKQVQKVEYYINPNLQANFDQKQAEFKVRAAFLLPPSSFLLLTTLRGAMVVIHPPPARAPRPIDVNLLCCCCCRPLARISTRSGSSTARMLRTSRRSWKKAFVLGASTTRRHSTGRYACAACQPSVPRALLLTPAYVVLLLRVERFL